MATTRLRKTFHYPGSSEEDSDLDEEHQEALLTTLATRDMQQTTLYRNAFLSIPLLSAVYFLITLFTATTARQRLLALLSASSLACTGQVLYFLPVRAADRKGKRAVWRVEVEEGGPLGRWLPVLNAGLAGVIGLSAVASWRRGAVEDAWKEALPASEFKRGTRLMA